MKVTSTSPRLWVCLFLALAVMFGWLAYSRRSSYRSVPIRQAQTITPQSQAPGSLKSSSQQSSLNDAAAQSSAQSSQSSKPKAPQQPSPFKANQELAERLEEEREEMEERLKRHDEPDGAMEFFRLKRAPVGERAVPTERYITAHGRMRQMPRFSTKQERFSPAPANTGAEISEAQLSQTVLGTWTSLGPGNIGGRTRRILIHPTSPNIMYAAGVAGGVWKTTNSGVTWTPLADLIANIAVNSLVMDPNDPNVIYAGTGEGYFNIDATRGAGIFKTTDGGTSWTRLANTNTSDFYYVNDLIISPTNSNRVYAGTGTGIWRSTDGGVNWTRVLNPGILGGCLDLVIRTDQITDYIFASCGTFTQSAIYRNTDAAGSGTWVSVLTESQMGRTSLALAPSNQSVIYALAASTASGNYQDGLHAVFRSTSNGDPGTWTAQVRNTNANKLNTLLLSNSIFAFGVTCGVSLSNQFYNQGWYDNVIAVDPADSNRVWAGGIDLFRSDDGGLNWGLASYWWGAGSNAHYAHADNHTIVFHPQYNGTTNKTMFVGSDGGIFRTIDARAAVATGATAACDPNNTSMSWSALNNNYGVTQFYHGLPYPNGTTYFGGTQDNGTLRGSDGGGVNAWASINGGDGGSVAIDPTNTQILYAENTGLSISKSTNGGVSFSSATSGITNSGFLFIAPFTMDPSNSQRLWTGGSALWRTTNAAASWTQASATLSGSVSAIGVAPSNGNNVLAGSESGFIYRTSIGLTSTSGTTWAAAQPRSGYVSWVAFDPTNANIAYATYSTFGGTHVWKSSDGGATWNGLDGSGLTGIPDLPVHCLVADPNNSSRLYIGTDLGVFTSTDGGLNWAVENTGFANVVVESLALNTVGGVTSLYAFTHGRGAWRVTVSSSSCSYTLSATSQSFGTSGGTGSVSVTAGTGCTWTATSNDSWITISSGSSGNGNGTVNYSVAANTGPARTGTMTIAGQTYTVTQSSGCTYTLSATSQAFSSSSGTGSVNITANTGCAWTAVSNDSWITISNGSSGTGNGTVNYSVAVNTGASRTGTMTIAGQTYTVTQSSGCTYTLSATSQSFSSSSGTGSVNVTAGTGCAWTAVSNAAWITISSGSSGTSNGTVNYSVAANTGAARTGTLTIAGQTFTVNQAAGTVTCTYTLSHTSQTMPVPGGSSSVRVTAPAGCVWTTSVDVDWVFITSNRTGSGTGLVSFTVGAAPDTDLLPRRGTLVIGGQSLSIVQSSLTSCSYTLSPTSQSFTASGGSGSVSLYADGGCNWTATSNANWLTIVSGSSGSSNGIVDFTVAANAGAARSGTLTIGGKTFTVSQAAGGSCSYTLSATSQSFSISGGTSSVNVTAGTGCTWTAASNDSWITISSGSSGNGNGTVNYSVAANTGPARTGTMTIAGQTYTVTQSSGCTFTLGATSQSFGSPGGTSNVSVTAGTGCAWTAVSNDNWITISSGGSGTSNGTVNYSVAVNTGASRTGTLTIAGQTFTVTQAAATCSFTLGATSQSFTAAGGTGSVSVTAGTGCAWTATSNNSWITISSGSSGTSNGTVNYSVAANASSSRTGTMTIAGQTFTVTQSSGCTYTLSATSQSFSSSSGTGSVNVTAGTGCAWTAVSNAAWITISSGSSGTGNGTVNYSVAANTGAARTGTLTIAGQTFTVNQAGTTATCTYTLSHTSQSMPVSGGNGSVRLTTPTGCTWTTSIDTDWVAITSNRSGSGTSLITFTVDFAPDPDRLPRTATIVIGGQNFTITQSSLTGCSYTLTTTNQSFPASGGSGSVSLYADGGCSWTATSNANWLSIVSGSSGTSNGIVDFTVAANTGPSRTGMLTIGGRTFTVTQAAGGSCGYVLSATSQSFSSSGGTSSVGVTAGTGCTWTAVSNDSWITITSGSSGNGNGTVNYSVAANTGPSRTGTLTIAGQTYTVTQSSGCSYTLGATSQSFSASAGTGSVSVTAGTGCTWNATSNDSWITITSGSSGNGNGTVNYSVTANSGAARTGTLMIAGQTFTVNQAASGCTFTLSATSQSFSSSSGTGSVNVTAGTGCAWTAVSNAAWITISSGSSGTGNGTVNYSVAANTGTARTGTLTIAGQTFTVNQAAGTATCAYTLSHTSQTMPVPGGSSSVRVSAPAGCVWTTSVDVDWVFITSNRTGSGTSLITFTVDFAPDPDRLPRTATIVIGGQNFTIIQSSLTSCSYTLNATSQSFTASGGSGSVSLYADGGCGWTATSNASWLTIVSGSSGSSNGIVDFTVATNTSSSPRTGTLTIGGRTFTVTQSGNAGSAVSKLPATSGGTQIPR